MKHILKCALFILIPVLIISLIPYPFLPKNNNKDSGMPDRGFVGVYGEQEDSLDALFIGNSISLCAVTPMELWKQYGIASYQCGTSEQHLHQGYQYLKEILKTQSPRVVVLETAGFFSEITPEMAVTAELELLFPAIEHHDRLLNLKPSDFTAPIHYEYVDDAKGYYPSMKTEPPAKAELQQYRTRTKESRDLPMLNRLYFERILELCRESGAELLLLSCPTVLCWDYADHNALEAVAREYDLPYCDLNLQNEVLGLDWQKHTRDAGDHLNHAGALLTTSFLGQYLRKNYDLPDHRGDPAFSDWEEALPGYAERLELFESGAVSHQKLFLRKK